MSEARRPTLLGSCARAATAAEARFRVDYPNSRPRMARVLALDGGAARALAPLAAQLRSETRLLRWADGGLRALDGVVHRDLADELEGTDLVVVVASDASGGAGAERIAAACAGRRLQPVGLALTREAEDALRPFTSVLVASADEDYLSEMLGALRA